MKNFRFKSLKVPVIVHLGREPSENDAPKSCTVQKSQILPSEGKLTFFLYWLLKVFLLTPNGGYFINYINDLSKIINGRKKIMIWMELTCYGTLGCETLGYAEDY